MDLEKKLAKYRLNKEEYQNICSLLGRDPEGIEWALFSALWSEHCSYKSSRRHLKKFYSESPRLVQGFGENAGVIDLGEGERVAFKMESHNHPSFIEPYQGAATGVGGILRDIFTMGARPIALGNYLCFGQALAERMQELVKGVVHGIAGYGNCVGVANVTGQTEFHASYDENILVNAFALGYFGKKDVLVTSKASGLGNYVVYVGAKTGRDGIHGASMASESFDEGSESKRPTVQIGDPFYEKLLIESCLEVIHQNLVVAIQDMGAAGLTSSSFEMASNGGVGLELNLDAVPLRDSSMSPEDILLSESQERMLLVCKPEKLEKIKEVFHRWNLEATKIGEVIEDKVITINWNGESLSSLDPDLLVENAPNYDRSYQVQEALSALEEFQTYQDLEPRQTLEKIFAHEQAVSREWIYRQYDQRVGANTAADCSQDVAVLVLPETQRPLGIVLGCRPALMRADASTGAQDAVLYPSLQLAMKGLEPLAVTDCLNYGNPEKENVMSDFVTSVESMSAACEALKAPVISGNVSFYNETRGQNITPTPSTGLVGLGEKISAVPASKFQKPGEIIYKVSMSNPIAWTGYLEDVGLSPETQGQKLSGELKPKEVAKFIKAMTQTVRECKPSATQVVGKFGLAYTLFKMCDQKRELSTHLQLKFDSETLFREKLYEVVLSFSQDSAEGFEAFMTKKFAGLQVEKIGEVISGSEIFFTSDQEDKISLEKLSLAYNKGWSNAFPGLER